jgi:hypothetical protein
MAREAFDELEIADGAEERAELERKLVEAAAAASPPRTESTPAGTPSQPTHSTRNTVVAYSPPELPAEAIPTPRAVPTSSQSSMNTSAQSSSSKPRISTSGSSSSSSSAKKGPVARELAKFRAEQARSSSAPSAKTSSGIASPRIVQVPLSTTPAQSSKVVAKRSTAAVPDKARSDVSDKSSSGRSGGQDDGDKAALTKKRKRERHPSPAFTSSEDGGEDEDMRGRAKHRTVSKKPAQPIPGPAKTQSPPPRPMPSFQKRKSPPVPLDLKNQPKSRTPSTVSSERPDDPEDLRDRYEELYPAYHLLTIKLSALHRAAEGMEIGEEAVEVLPSTAEMEKMVKKWERWHMELAGIRKWFGSVA